MFFAYPLKKGTLSALFLLGSVIVLLAATTRCPRCGYENPDEFRYCVECAYEMRPATGQEKTGRESIAKAKGEGDTANPGVFRFSSAIPAVSAGVVVLVGILSLVMYFRRKKTRASLLDVRPDIPAETVRQTRVTRLDRTVKPAKHKRILLFDDNVNWARIFQFCLEKEGFEVHHSIDPRDVMKRIDEVRPDLVVMDLHFPGFSGSEAIRQIKSREANRELPVIMLTVDDTQTAKMEAMKAGARNFLSKSISNEQLVGAIKAYMANTAFKGTIVPDSTGRPPSSSGSEP